ncbi:MAG: terminase [Actinomycetota bacterium]|nr:terminase [Actinomycetota bacterium]
MNPLAVDLAASLDPATFARRAGFEPEPWQADILRETHPRVVLNCCRQAGKSTLAAVLAVHQAVYDPGSLTLLLAPSLRQSTELFRKVLHAYKRLHRPVPSEAETTLRLELESGSRIIALPGTEATTRGFSAVGLLIVDEASRVLDETFAAARPMLDPDAGRIMLLSTPFGARGFFYEATRDPDTWRTFTVSGEEVARLSPRFLREQERALGAWWFDQEYRCIFLDAATAAFASDDIEGAFGKVETWNVMPFSVWT